MTGEITVVGGGLAGLTAAIACAEAGATVTLHEAHSTLGGRGRATSGPYVAHEGAHVFYADGAPWAWLKERGLAGEIGWPPASALLHAGFRSGGRFTRRPPLGFLRLAAARGKRAPVDRDFRSWATETFGERAAESAANAISVATYDADTGRLSARYVHDLLLRVFGPRLLVRWVVGGWQAVIDRMGTRARELGVRIELKSRLTELPGGPTIVATELSSARNLLGDQSLTWESGDCVMLDVAVRHDRRDAFIAFDLDEGGFHECYTAQDPTIAPTGESLFQLDMPVRKGEKLADAHQRLERFTDAVLPGWQDRTTWRRTGRARGRTGAIELPGFTWHDRPAIDRGDDVFLAGDMVAAPGMRGKISMNSALLAADGAVRALETARRAA